MAWPTKTDFVDGDVLTAAQVNNIGTNLNIFNPTSATNGQVPIANGAGSAAWGDIAAGGMTVISSGTAISVSTLTFSSIPQTYRALRVAFFVNGTSTAALACRINNSGSTDHLSYYWNITSSATAQGRLSQSYFYFAGGDSSNGSGSAMAFFPNYTSAVEQLYYGYGGSEFSVTHKAASVWGKTTTEAAITRLDIFPLSGTMTGSYYLIGEK